MMRLHNIITVYLITLLYLQQLLKTKGMVHGKTNEDGQSRTKFLEKQQGKNYYILVVQSGVNIINAVSVQQANKLLMT